MALNRHVYPYDFIQLVAWKRDGTLDEILKVLRESVRIKAGRKRLPSASIIDSQTSKTANVSESVGYDGAKKTIRQVICNN